MNRLVTALLSALIFMVALHGFLVWRASERAHEDAARQSCLQRAEATAMIALLAPSSEVDPKGRLGAIAALGAQVDDC